MRAQSSSYTTCRGLLHLELARTGVGILHKEAPFHCSRLSVTRRCSLFEHSTLRQLLEGYPRPHRPLALPL